eukprot:scaffold1870_cov73-Cyclotella_meneghiniana.AAC.9
MEEQERLHQKRKATIPIMRHYEPKQQDCQNALHKDRAYQQRVLNDIANSPFQYYYSHAQDSIVDALALQRTIKNSCGSAIDNRSSGDGR